MKKILIICFTLLFFLGAFPVSAEEEADDPAVGEILALGDYEAVMNYLKEGGEERWEWFRTACSEEEWFHFLFLQKAYYDSMAVKGELRQIGKDPSASKKLLKGVHHSMDGLQSGVFEEGAGVLESDRKYIYKHNTEASNLLKECGVNEATERLNMTGNVDYSVRRFILWAPNWGRYRGEQVGVEIIIDKLVDRGAWEYLFASWGRPFQLYLENSLQTLITVNFYRNVDRSSKVPNGEQVVFDTACEHLLFSAIGLTNETDQFDSIEYSAPIDENADIYTVVPEADLSTGVHNGRTVYYNNKPQNNADIIYEMKGRDSAQIYVGILGNGDGSMLFSIGFTSFGSLPQAYCLNLDPNGGRLQGEEVYEGASGSTVHIEDPVWENHRFEGWTFTRQNGILNGRDYTFGEGHAALRADWSLETYPITYILNGGENHPDNPSSYTPEDDITLGDPTKTGYTFTGWKEGNHIPPGSTGEKTFTAEWEKEIYPIEYRLNGGENHPDNPSEYTVDDEISILDAAKKGYRFTGWKEGNMIPKGSTGPKTFTAEYEQLRYPILYVLGGGENHPSNPDDYTVEDEVTILDASREHYLFKGWKEGNFIPAGSTGSKMFTALWEAEVYPITYELNGGFNDPSNPFSYAYDEEVIIRPAKKQGYSFTGWYEGNFIPKGSFGARHFTALYEAEAYPISYELDGGINDPANPSSYTIEDEIVLASPKKEGFVFAGWKEGDRIPKGSTGEKTFTATWRYKVVDTVCR